MSDESPILERGFLQPENVALINALRRLNSHIAELANFGEHLGNFIGLRLDTGGPWPDEQREHLRSLIGELTNEDATSAMPSIIELLQSVLDGDWD